MKLYRRDEGGTAEKLLGLLGLVQVHPEAVHVGDDLVGKLVKVLTTLKLLTL